MLPSSVAKCMTTNYYAIIYDHDHSKHINDHLRCRQDNGATCLNCKVDFSLKMLTTASLLSSPLPHHSLSTPAPPPLLLKCKQSGSVTQLVRPSLIHITCTHSPSFHLSLPFLSVSLSPCPGMIKDSFVTLCEASRKQKTSNR